jgi:hypothetical protein
MDEWSTLFTAAALGGVLVTFIGSWWAVRTFRARRKGDGRRAQSSSQVR